MNQVVMETKYTKLDKTMATMEETKLKMQEYKPDHEWKLQDTI